MPVTEDDGLRELLDTNRIAVVGCSRTPGKPAHDVPAYLQRHGYEITPVNPFADEILGREAYGSLSEVPGTIDVVEVFRPSDEVPDVVDDVVERARTRGDVRALWLQQGIRHDDAAARAEAAGLRVVQDRCMMVDHQRLVG